MVFDKRLVQSGHVREFTIRRDESGWEVREAQDRRIVRLHCSTDWHRIELMRAMFEQQIDLLERAGWTQS